MVKSQDASAHGAGFIAGFESIEVTFEGIELHGIGAKHLMELALGCLESRSWLGVTRDSPVGGPRQKVGAEVPVPRRGGEALDDVLPEVAHACAFRHVTPAHAIPSSSSRIGPSSSDVAWPARSGAMTENWDQSRARSRRKVHVPGNHAP